MNPLEALHNQALQDLEGLMGNPQLSWLGFDYPCVPSSLERGTVIDFGGRLVEIKLSLTVRTSAVQGAAKPLEAGKVISYGGESYRIATAKLSGPGDHIKLQLIDPNR